MVASSSARFVAACASVIIVGFAGFTYYLFNSKKKRLKYESCTKVQDKDNGKVDTSSSKGTLKRVPSVVGLLSSEEAVVLVGMLQLAFQDTQDTEQLKKVLTTIANGAAFTANQNLIRDAGGLPLLLLTLESVSSSDVRERAANALSNLAVNYNNQKTLQDLDCSSVIIRQLDHPRNSEGLQLSLLRLLTNLSVSTEWHESLLPTLPRLIQNLDGDVRKDIQLQSLKALVNFSCNPVLFMQLIATKVNKTSILLLLSSEDIDILLRLLTFLSNLACTKNNQKISRKQFLREGCKEATFGSVMYGKSTQELLSELSFIKGHRDTEVSNLASRVYACLA